MDFGVGMGRDLRMDELADHALVAEESGFSHLTLLDQPHVTREMLVMMTVAAMNTHSIRIGQGVTDPFTYHPVIIAAGTASINELSGGRAFVGIGAGGAWGKAMEKPLPMQELREAILFIRRYMAGEEAEFKGMKMHSEWLRRPVPIYMACAGPKSCQLAGEVADGAIVGSINPEKLKWHVELIEKGALKARRDPSEIDIWCRTLCYVAESKEAARREVAPMAASWARNDYMAIFQRDSSEVTSLRQRMERAEPGLIDEFKTVYEAFDPYQNQVPDSPHAKLATQRIIDFFLLTGTPGDICERIYSIGQLGVKTISMVLYTVSDKKGMMREIGNKIIPIFRD